METIWIAECIFFIYEYTLSNLEVHKEINIDFVVNRQRRCGCPCSACKERGVHSVENCEIECSDIVNEA
jgi:hypothetical protein